MNKLKQIIKWIKDRLFTLIGCFLMVLTGVLIIIKQWGGGLGMSNEFANATINAVLVIGTSFNNQTSS
jgi:hypothetical protein